ncbi:MAG TPA: glycoside hydrolase family 3 N-terminal domain-containing protein, partial [Terriglobia bacterium]|nr:glycoside hydrolase family 3 N-terminal domain-containing protein [Terriglobia bacterium]
MKHFAAHGQPESGTNCAPANISERTLRDTFLYPFREVLQHAGAMSVMASYNEIDGVPSHANEWLLRDVLRKEWGFKGFIVSDYYAITELNVRPEASSHAVARDKSHAALLAAKAGVNIETPDPDCYPHLVDLVRTGQLEESVVDELVFAMLRYKFELGLFDDPYVDAGAIHIEERLDRERALALKAARETIVLLKNLGGILPLTMNQGRTLAVIGPNADRSMLGGYSGKPKYDVTVLQGIREKAGSTMRILYSEGCKLTVGGTWNDDVVVFADHAENKRMIAEAVETARQADAVLLVLGENEQTSREAWNRNHMGDRASLELFGAQRDLVKAVATTGKPIIMLLLNGRPNAIGDV